MPRPRNAIAELVGDGDDLVDVLRELLLVRSGCFADLAAQLELPARLERDRRLAALEGDHVSAFEARLPAEPVREPAQHRLDAARPVVGRRAARPAIDRDLLVLGADAPFAARLRPGRKVLDQRVTTAHGSFQLGCRLHEIGHGFPIQRPSRRY